MARREDYFEGAKVVKESYCLFTMMTEIMLVEALEIAVHSDWPLG